MVADLIYALIGVAVARGTLSALLVPGGYPREWLDVIGVAGMRGGLCVALALAIPEAVSDRGAIIAATQFVSARKMIECPAALALRQPKEPQGPMRGIMLGFKRGSAV